VLKGDAVTYAAWNSIKGTLDYDFNMEKQFSYEGLPLADSVRHLAKFTSDLWQIHSFGEGSTRATAVFMIKYMEAFGFDVNNEAFEHYSWYFRNALVRANYNDWKKGVHAITKFLEPFFSNLLMETEHELKNRYMHLDYVEEFQSVDSKIPKCQNDTLEELAILRLIIEYNEIRQNEIVKKTGKSLSTVKRIMKSLREKQYIRRINGKRYGSWEVLKGARKMIVSDDESASGGETASRRSLCYVLYIYIWQEAGVK